MSKAKMFGAVLSLMLVGLFSACQSVSPARTGSDSAVPSELVQKPYLFEVVRYLYRWQLDEAEVARIVGAKQFVFWIRRVEAPLDPGDRSAFAEILLPQLDLRVNVKKADYRIEELNTEVQSKTFRITQVIREALPGRAPRGSEVVKIDMQEMRDYLFRTRAQHDYPDPALIARLQQALRKEAAREGILTNDFAGNKIVHIAPLSPVANEIWAFWEAGRKLFSFSSDIDLENPSVWQHETLLARLYDLDQQVVVSHEEAPGSNRFLTRYEVSRALFNCLLFGQRLTVQPPNTKEAPVTK
jgi:hypothetical protein